MEKENKNCHPRMLLSGIPLAGYVNKENTSYNSNTQAEDCRTLRAARHSAMTALFKSRAFTLIELLVVVLIIGILAAVAVPQYRFAVEKARATEAIMAVQTWASALERYRLANGSYPETESSAKSDIDITLPNSKQFSQYYFHTSGTIYIAYHNNHYMISKVLVDSTSSKEWVARGLTCNTRAAGTTDDFGAKVCKALCGKSNLTVVWGSGQYGCSIKY